MEMNSTIIGLRTVIDEIENEREVKLEKIESLVEIKHEIEERIDKLRQEIGLLEYRADSLKETLWEVEELQ